MRFQLKRIILPACLLLLAAAPALAQRNRVSFGIEGGPGLSTLRGNPVLKDFHRALPVFTAGAYTRLQLPGQLYLRAGLNVGQMGSRSIKDIEVSDTNGNMIPGAAFSNRFTYLTMPVFVGASFVQNHVFVQAGPWVGLL
ncbi:MAG: hypothetical protein EOO11_21870, partial [Chitinophagaceae bacterium]